MALTTVCTGFEFGATSGWATGSAGKKIFDVITGSPTISTTSPATGTYCLRCAPSAATCAVQWDTNTFGGSQTFARRVFKILLESLPSADTILAQVDSGVGCLFQFKQSSGKFAMNFEGDALTDGGPVISTGVWYTIEQYVSVGGGTRTCDWWIDGAPMTQVTHVSAAGSINALVLGCNFTSQTFTARYDDVVAWVDTSAIGDKGKHKVIFLGIDTAATVTLGVGASSNWNTFAGATPTLTAWNATTARDNVDERPVNTTSAQDGIALVANAPTNTWYVEIPMTTYSLVSGETVTMARMLCCGWQASGSSANCGIRSFNGTTETVLLATSTAFTALGNNTASPGWICGMLTPADIDTQSELDALAIRWGFSTDGNPDIGFHAIYVELAVKVSGAATIDATATIVGVGALADTVVQGVTATLAGAGVLTAPAVQRATATLTGAGVLAATVTQRVTATLTGAGVVAAPSIQRAPSSPTGAGALTALVTQGATATLAGAGVLSASATVTGGTINGTATITGAGVLNAPATQGAIATLTGTGALTAQVTQGVTATLTGAGVLSATSVQRAGATPTGTGVVSASATVTGGTVNATAALVGAGTVTAVVSQQATSSLAGAGALSAAGYNAGTATLAGAGTLAAAATQGATAALAGAGVLVAVGSGGVAAINATAALVGIGVLSAAVDMCVFYPIPTATTAPTDSGTTDPPDTGETEDPC